MVASRIAAAEPVAMMGGAVMAAQSTMLAEVVALSATAAEPAAPATPATVRIATAVARAPE